ncbi:MAG: hypothetical protein K2W94_04645 [Alphaproteobacteria bacterium]|nr:hypothetical protein [Alphaproteobacteria bacterium]
MSTIAFPTKEEIYQTLQKQFYIELPFPMQPGTIQEAVDSFFKFLEEPESVKTHINYTIAPLHRRGDVGYKHRDPTESIYNDSKEFFHFHPTLFDKYADFLEKHPAVYDFAKKAKPIWDLAYQTVFKTLSTLEPDFPGLCSKIFDTEAVHIQLRFLKYDWKSSGKYLAKPHFDAGSFSLAIAESCPGLRIGSNPDNLKPVHHKAESAVFMLSSNFQKVMDTDQLSPGWHDVIQTDETLIGKPFARWAVVAFIEADGVEALPRSETHKWYAAS